MPPDERKIDKQGDDASRDQKSKSKMKMHQDVRGYVVVSNEEKNAGLEKIHEAKRTRKRN